MRREEGAPKRACWEVLEAAAARVMSGCVGVRDIAPGAREDVGIPATRRR